MGTSTPCARYSRASRPAARRANSTAALVVDDFPAVDPDLVIVEVRGDNDVRGSDRHYQNHYIMFLYLRDGRVCRGREFSNPDVYRTAVNT